MTAAGREVTPEILDAAETAYWRVQSPDWRAHYNHRAGLSAAITAALAVSPTPRYEPEAVVLLRRLLDASYPSFKTGRVTGLHLAQDAARAFLSRQGGHDE